MNIEHKSTGLVAFMLLYLRYKGMKYKIKKYIIIAISLILLIIMISIFYVMFMEKDFEFYMGNDIKNIESIELIIDASKNTEEKSVMIYDKEVIDEIMEKLAENRLKPNYSGDSDSLSGKGFSIIVYGEEKKQLYYLANHTNTEWIIDIGIVSNGKVDEGIRSWVGITSIGKEEGEELYEFVSEVIEENARNITISDIKEFGKNKEYDWNVFKQFIFNDVDNMGKKIRENFTSSNVAKFKIEEINAYMYVWYYEGTVVNSKGTNEYWLVCDALIYDEKGNSISIYNEGLDEFLEELE